MGAIRLVVLLLVRGLGALLMCLQRRGPEAQPMRVSYVATAHQLGVVGYRDPAGAISPDGAWIACGRAVALTVWSDEAVCWALP